MKNRERTRPEQKLNLSENAMRRYRVIDWLLGKHVEVVLPEWFVEYTKDMQS
jgi:hypothetical protein